MVQAHIINDLKRMNKHHRNEKINKQLQIFLHEILQKQSNKIAKIGLQVAIKLYKRNIWNDPKTVNIIASGCFNDYYKVKLVACYFLLETTWGHEEENSDEEDDEEVLDRELSKSERKINKKTKWRV